MRVESCGDEGCEHLDTSDMSVVINILGHEAVRVWYDGDGLYLDWDELPGKYMVQYRQSGDDEWQVSQALSSVGYDLTESIALLEGEGTLIIRVSYNCNDDGENCEPLGRFPNNTLETVSAQQVLSAPSRARSAGTNDAMENDPVTGLLRADLAVTHEEQEDSSIHRCVSRPAENAWETSTIGDRPKSCSYVQTIDQYMFSPDAEFPDSAICGIRKTNTDAEREVYGDKVKVCNDFAPFEGGNGPGPVSDSVGNSSRSHLESHIADRYLPLDWPADYALSEGDSYRCTRFTKTSNEKYVPHGHHLRTKITVDWCYDWRHRVEMVQTLRATSELYESESVLILQKFCGWVDGHSPSNPNETIWQYEHPDDQDVLDWGYTSQVRAKYGNKYINKNWANLIPACSTSNSSDLVR